MRSRKLRHGYSRAAEGRESARRISYAGRREVESNSESAHDSAEDGKPGVWNPCMNESKRKNGRDWGDTLKGQEEGSETLVLQVDGERGMRKRRAPSTTSICEEDDGKRDKRTDLLSVKEGDLANHLGSGVFTPRAGEVRVDE